ncbi:TonB-dependent receptor [Luteimonas fraxinea]|uniref:TonB-dependent receptor n=1 Tax=Luteimonas fraxinea TaxID=2901869 RepID=A0ABS8UAZ2_9GAMM|nr:TonB-dependent receptor [Luteimonas fraxinea]MCD9096035.1 TonB-dependent receptor [Luteimonas fraxinea]MCD9124624.1 TonB-dependent receptor [Luteimonas fraxinea]UHH10794.1 TonB-dependent receptor [Luteimonas fraxinea]
MTRSRRSALVPTRLAIAVALLLPAAAFAQSTSQTHAHPTTLDRVQVTATPLGGDAENLAHPVEVLYGDALEDRKAGNLGDTVSSLPGVQSGSFGTGVGRPIIRGQEGPRVQVLSGGIGSMDASTVSADHAVSIEPFLADQIEVLKGPANLLYGSGAIGGAVNVVDGRIAREVPDRPISGRAELRAASGNDERSGMFRLDGVSGENLVLHVDGLIRNTGDFDIPGFAQVPEDHDHDHDHDHEHAEEENAFGTLPNSSIRTRAGAVGATYFGERGHLGVAVSTYRTNYGLPDGAHVHAEEGGHDHDHDHDHEEEGHDEHGSVRIDMVQNRVDLKGGLYDPLPFLSALNVRAAYNDYEHVELEGGTAATRFTNKGTEARIEAVQKTFNGWDGAFGLQIGHVDFSAVGEEAFVPPSVTDTLGLFVVQEKEFGPVKLELGGRHERVEIDPITGNSRKFDASSLSGAAIWHLSDVFDLRFGADVSERAPTNEELFAAGPHIATRSIEIGDADLDTERGQRLEIGLHAHTDRVEFKAAVYQTQFKRFTYLTDTGIAEQSFPVRLWTQGDATFRGAEAEAKFHLLESDAGDFDLRVFGDVVRAELDGSGTRTVQFAVPHGDHAHNYETDIALGGDLPRIAPSRIGADINWTLGGWRANVGAVRYQKQDRVAALEDPSPGYTLVNAGVAWRVGEADGTQWELFLDGRNLTDEEARPHTSLLRDFAPLPGRTIAGGIRVYF